MTMEGGEKARSSRWRGFHVQIREVYTTCVVGLSLLPVL